MQNVDPPHIIGDQIKSYSLILSFSKEYMENIKKLYPELNIGKILLTRNETQAMNFYQSKCRFEIIFYIKIAFNKTENPVSTSKMTREFTHFETIT